MQLDLFKSVSDAYAEHGRITNNDLYSHVAMSAGIDRDDIDCRIPIGEAKSPHSPIKRKVRWHQQDLRSMGLIERVDGERGVWQLTEKGRRKLRPIKTGIAMLAYSTDLGVAIWSNAEDAFSRFDVPITLCVTSPPYPLKVARAYGNPSEQEYVDFICRVMEPVIKRLAPDGSICINVGNDIFEHKMASRSLYRERLVLALCERFGLHKMDELIWHNPTKPPGPLLYASVDRTQLNYSWEPVYWFAVDPTRVKADNRRVLLPHTEKHKKLMERGGESRPRSNSDGAHRVRVGSYGKKTKGRIPRNVLSIPHANAQQMRLNERLIEMGLPKHGATMPLALATFLIKFLTDVNDLVVDPCFGSGVTGFAAEELGRPWVGTERILQYVRGSAERFTSSAGFWMNPALEAV